MLILPNKDCLRPCFGVKKAIDECNKIKNKKDFLVFRKLVHNKQLNEFFDKNGLKSTEDLDTNKTIIIGAHGIDKEKKEFLKKNDIKFLDLTCPFVFDFLNKAIELEKKGYKIVIIGDKEHIEIKNICSFLNDPIVNEYKELPDKVAVFTQTTQTQGKIDEVLPIIKKECKEVIYIDSRCFETKKRQEEAERISKKVDYMLVIGDKESRNTNNLCKICSKNTKSKLIESKDEIKNVKGKIGVIAGASTPEFIVKEILEKLK